MSRILKKTVWLPGLLLVVLPLAASLSYTPAQPQIGQTVAFTLAPTYPNLVADRPIVWNFGDGIAQETNSAVRNISHAYSNPGTYTVSAAYYYYIASIIYQNTETTVVVIAGPNRIVTFAPPQPNVGETVTFQAQNFLTPTAIDWNFGDGTTVNDGASLQTHVFNNPGTYPVQASDQHGAAAPVTVSVPVVNKRQIQFSPAGPKTGQAVAFQAVNFVTAQIRWDFGDGTAPVVGGTAISHVFKKPGVFQTSAQDASGPASWSAAATVSVSPAEGPLASFALSYGILRFQDGKTNILVNKGALGLEAFLDLKYEGTGQALFEWRVDSQVFKTASASLTFGQQTTIASGKSPGLPTVVPGLHTVEVRFIQPQGVFNLPPITYTVATAVATTSASLQAPVVESVDPVLLEPGKQYVLNLNGKRLTPDTTVTFGSGVGVVGSLQVQSAQKAVLRVFVAPTTQSGERMAKASNPSGTAEGPGKIQIALPVQAAQVSDLALECTDLQEIPHLGILLYSPGWFDLPSSWSTSITDSGQVSYTPAGSNIRVPTVDDYTVLKWQLPTNSLEYLELRFFEAKSQKTILVKTLPGSAKQFRLTGDVLAELFAALGGGQAAYASQAPLGQLSVGVNQDAFSGQTGQSTVEAQIQTLYSLGLAQGADVAWGVVGFRTYTCVYDSTKGGPSQKQFGQAVEEASSDLWLFKMPARFTGLACPSSGKQGPGVAIQAINLSAGARDAAGSQEGLTANTSYVGDKFELRGSFSLAEAPYLAYGTGSSFKIENLFIDWGDGSSAASVLAEAGGTGTWTKDKVATLISSYWSQHIYKAAGNYTARLFMLSLDDIQAPPGAFYAALGAAVTPNPPGSMPYQEILSVVGGGGPSSQPSPGPNPLTNVLSRAYMIYCVNITIQNYTDLCATGPLQLVSLEILNFPGHDVIKPGESPGSEGGVRIRKDLLATYGGISAVAVTCDSALFARAKLRYFGQGWAEFTWTVDGIPVGTRVEQLASHERPNLGPNQTGGCGDALVANYIFSSGAFPVTLGRHEVKVYARILTNYSQTNYSQAARQATAGLGNVFHSAAAGADESVGGPRGRGEYGASAPYGGAAGTVSSWLSQLKSDEMTGKNVPQVGFLSPNAETGGNPPVVYLNDGLKNWNPPPPSSQSPWLPGEFTDSSQHISSDPKIYIVNEVRDRKFCKILFPTSGGEFHISDLGTSMIELQNDVYNGVGTFHFKIRCGTGKVEEYFAAGTSFSGWLIEEASSLVLNGTLDVQVNCDGLSFTGVNGTLRRLQGQVSGGGATLHPLTASFGLKLKKNTFYQLVGGSNIIPAWSSVPGALEVEGNWISGPLTLDKTQVGKTGFALEASAVVMDFSAKAAAPGATGVPASPTWTGVFLGQAKVIPYTFDWVSTGFQLTNLPSSPWTIGEAGLSGQATSGPFQTAIQEGSFSFDHLEFIVTADSPQATYFGCSLTVPWIEAVLHGDAKLQFISDASGYGTDWPGLTSNPVALNYADRGRMTMTVSDLVFGRDSRGWRARGRAQVGLETENRSFASFGINGLNFGLDARAYFDGPAYSATINLAGSSTFGQTPAELQSVLVTTPPSGNERLHFDVLATLRLSPDSIFIPAHDVHVNYKVTRTGAAYGLTGPWNLPFSLQVSFPQGSGEMQGTINPVYAFNPAQASAAAEPGAGPWASGLSVGTMDGAGAGAPSGDQRYSGSIDLSFMGVNGLNGSFVLGYRNGQSYYLMFVQVPNLNVPLAPTPLFIYSLGGGFGHNFPLDAFRKTDISQAEPDMAGLTVFAGKAFMGTADRFVLTMTGLLALGTNGEATMAFDQGRVLGVGNFGGQLHYKSGVFDGSVWGELDLLGGLVNFNLGSAGVPALEFRFGGGGWHIYAGHKDGQRIKAKIWKVEADSYLMLDSSSLRLGGMARYRLSANPTGELVDAYVEGLIDVGVGIYVNPFALEGSFQAGVEAGGCLGDICQGIGVKADVYAHAPDPIVLRASVTIDFLLESFTITVDL